MTPPAGHRAMRMAVRARGVVAPCWSSTPTTRPEPIEDDNAERRALEAAVAEARADPRSAPHAEVRAWLLRLAAGEFHATPPAPRAPSPREP